MEVIFLLCQAYYQNILEKLVYLQYMLWLYLVGGIAGIIGPALANMFTGTDLYLVLTGLYFIGFLVMTICLKSKEK